ncbi:hypothetical protein ABBQ38_009940 [Trebouxia sp. C0009 RCD-2024]
MRREAQAGNDKVLSYGDNLLRRGDVELLQGPHWLNDQIITFYFDYLRLERFAKEHDDVLFVGGAMTFLLNQPAGTGALSDIVAPLEKACPVCCEQQPRLQHGRRRQSLEFISILTDTR